MVDKLNQVGMRDMEMELGRLTVVEHEAFHALLAVHCIVRLQEQGAHMAVLKKHSLLLLYWHMHSALSILLLQHTFQF